MIDSRSRQRGATLLEVLIAVLVLSIGLLGALKLQTLGVRQNADSRYTVMAAAFAQDALDALAYNPRGDKADWDGINSTTAAGSLSGRAGEWLTALQRDLPQGTADVSCNATQRQCSVVISWIPPGGDKMSATYAMYN